MKKYGVLVLLVVFAVLCLSSVAFAKYKIAFVPKLIGIPYFNAMEEGGKKAAADLDVEFIYTGPVTADVAKQIEIVDNLITQGVNAIAVAPNDPAAIAPVLKKAKEKGIVVMTSDTDGDFRDLFVNQALQDEIGYTTMDELAKAMGEEGEFAIVSCGPTAWNLNTWILYELQRLANYPKMKLVTIRYAEEDVQQAINVMLDLINAFPNLKGVIGQCSTSAPGVAEAIEQAGKSGQIVATGISVPSMMAKYVKSGTVKSFVLWNPVDLGYLTVWAAKYLLDGNQFEDGKEYDVPGISTKPKYIAKDKMLVLGPPKVFDASNIEEFEKLF
ncbi:MAG: autoinducer 2 ABC transporter substrate-binding protein [Candidatus Atribacteria bacterium]|nr:autoinducer 2 ABC transporter substrate-binding protein [Candidatus Atribacteria bacterium]